MTNYITVEQFLEQPKEIQKVFIDWWEPRIGDLFAWSDEKNSHDMHEVSCCSSRIVVDITTKNKGYEISNRIPLLQMHQLIQFIEDKGFYIEFNNFKNLKEVYIYKQIDQVKPTYFLIGNNLLQILWQVAVEVAKEN